MQTVPWGAARVLGVAATVSTLTGCRCEAGGEQRAAPLAWSSGSGSATSAASQSPAPRVLKPLGGATTVALSVAGFGDAVVSVPQGATQPRPLVIALHGNKDRPEWQCQTWREVAGPRPWIVCPRGQPRDDSKQEDRRFTYSSAEDTAKELRAVLKALKQRYTHHVAKGSVVLAGFSLGARHAIQIAKQEPAFFARLVLIEGGAKQWSSGAATIFRDGGGKKVLFACGQKDCVDSATTRQSLSQRLGVTVRVVDGGEAGHIYDGPVAEALKKEYAWLVEDDPRFRGASNDD